MDRETPAVLTASDVKGWFQYRCPRKLIKTVSKRGAAAHDRGGGHRGGDGQAAGVWARDGNRYEVDVHESLSKLIPPLDDNERLERVATRTATWRHLGEGIEQVQSGSLVSCYVRELELNRAMGDLHVVKYSDLVPGGERHDETIRLGITRPDLLHLTVARDGEIQVQVIDIKYERRDVFHHRMQVAYYAILLRNILARSGIERVTIHPRGAIYRPPGTAAEVEQAHEVSGGVYVARDFKLKLYERQVERFLEDVESLIAKEYHHVNFRCEQCEYLQVCLSEVGLDEDGNASPASVGTLHPSAIPGFTQSEIRTLDRHLRPGPQKLTLEQFRSASARGGKKQKRCQRENWNLRRIWSQQEQRADAIIESRSRIATEGESVPRTYNMPHRVGFGDDCFFVAADSDPIDGNLVTIGIVHVRNFLQGNGDVLCTRVEVLENSTAEQEINGLRAVFHDVLLAGLIEAAKERRAAHIFVYEPSEFSDIVGSFARQLSGSDLQLYSLLVHIIRILPPPAAAREPGYAGVDGLPFTVVRPTVERMYALNARVSLDLRRVSKAMADFESEDVAPPNRLKRGSIIEYVPSDGFIEGSDRYVPGGARLVHAFSSRLSLDVARALRGAAKDDPKSELTTRLTDIVRDDVVQRLSTLRSVVAAMLDHDSAYADTQLGRMLLLEKQPFQFHERAEPLHNHGIPAARLLLLQHNYECEKQHLATLNALVRPPRQRVGANRCIGALRYGGVTASFADGRWYGLDFASYQDRARCRGSELFREDAFSVVVHAAGASTVLDSRTWKAARIDGLRRGRQYDVEIFVRRGREKKGPFPSLESDDQAQWYLDLVDLDTTTQRMTQFLEYLSGSVEVADERT